MWGTSSVISLLLLMTILKGYMKVIQIKTPHSVEDRVRVNSLFLL